MIQGKGRAAWVVAGAALVAGAFAQAAPAKPRTELVSRKSGKAAAHVGEYPSVSASGRFVAFESLAPYRASDDDMEPDVFVRDRKTRKTQPISIKSNGDEVDGDAEQASISANGRFVAFTADGKLVGSDSNGSDDVYVRDRKRHKTTRVSVKSNGSQLFYDSSNPSISANGRFVVFQSEGPFVGTDENGLSDVYVRDRKTRKTKRVSLRNGGGEPVYASVLSEDAPNRGRRISADGRFIAFVSADSLMTGQPDCCINSVPSTVDDDIFVRDMQKKKTIRVSLTSNEQEADPDNQVSSTNPVISGSGRFVAFQSIGEYVGSDGNSSIDVYVRDLERKRTARVSVSSSEAEDTGGSARPDISASGRYVTFESDADLVGSDGNGFRDIYMRDRKAGKTKRISVKSNGDPVDANHQLASVSGDGRFVAFQSLEAFTATDQDSDWDVYIRGPLR
jgi:WD40-like Beta Propeller Repeat